MLLAGALSKAQRRFLTVTRAKALALTLAKQVRRHLRFSGPLAWKAEAENATFTPLPVREASQVSALTLKAAVWEG